jgi:hypothetical protein
MMRGKELQYSSSPLQSNRHVSKSTESHFEPVLLARKGPPPIFGEASPGVIFAIGTGL